MFAGCFIWQAAVQIRDGHVIEVARADGGPLATCAWNMRLECSLPTKTRVISALVILCVLTYCVMFVWYLIRVALHLRRQLYQRYRLMHQLFQMQARSPLQCHRTLLTPLALLVLCCSLRRLHAM